MKIQINKAGTTKYVINYDSKKIIIENKTLKSDEIYEIFKNKKIDDIKNIEVVLKNNDDKVQNEIKKIIEEIIGEISKSDNN